MTVYGWVWPAGICSAGSWWVEYLPFFTASQLQSALAKSNSASLLPSGTDYQQELFRGLLRCHVEAASVQGEHSEQVVETHQLVSLHVVYIDPVCVLAPCSC